MRATEVHNADLNLDRVVAVFALGKRPDCVGGDGFGKDTKFRAANFAKLVGRALVLLRAGDGAYEVAMVIQGVVHPDQRALRGVGQRHQSEDLHHRGRAGPARAVGGAIEEAAREYYYNASHRHAGTTLVPPIEHQGVQPADAEVPGVRRG